MGLSRAVLIHCKIVVSKGLLGSICSVGSRRGAAAVTSVGRCGGLLSKIGPWSDMSLSLDLVSFAVSNVKPFPMSMQCWIPMRVKTARNQRPVRMILHG